MSTTFTNLLFHIVFSTKVRRPQIRSEFEDELKRCIGGVIKHERGTLLEAGGTEDHLHLLVKFRADVSVSEMVRRIKSNSPKWLREKDPEWKGWQTGYGAFSVSESRVAGVRDYLRCQREHHRKSTFLDELKALLERHGLEYDERYL